MLRVRVDRSLHSTNVNVDQMIRYVLHVTANDYGQEIFPFHFQDWEEGLLKKQKMMLLESEGVHAHGCSLYPKAVKKNAGIYHKFAYYMLEAPVRQDEQQDELDHSGEE